MEATYWLDLASICDRFKCLPEAGSLFDQRPHVMSKIRQALRAIDKVAEEDLKKDT